MRTLKNFPYPQDTDISKFPYGQIQNETATEEGTPVVREVYGDLLTNIYKIVKDSGLDFNQLEDSEINGYQLLDALKVFSNNLNDLEQVVTVSATQLQVNFDIDNLPNNYVFIGKLSDAVTKDVNYQFSGTGTRVLNFTNPVSLSANNIVVVSIKSSTITINSITRSEDNAQDFILTPFSGVLSFNSGLTTYYLSDGYLISNTPTSVNIQQAIRLFESDATISVSDAVIHKDKLLVMAKSINVNVYDFYIFDLANLSTVESKLTYTQVGTTDFLPYLYADKDFIYLTNNGNNSSSDNILDKIEVDLTLGNLNKVSEITLENSFQKTSNAFFKNGEIYTFVNGNLNLYKLNGTMEFKLFINNINGQLFVQNDQIYFTSGEIATIWNV